MDAEGELFNQARQGDNLITLEQLAGFARKNHVGQYYQEKDYFQTVFLRSLYSIADKAVLKGGTCLKMVYKYPRFSEDLDFNSTLGPKKLQELVHRVLKEVALWGMKSSFDKEELFKEAYAAQIRFEGPRFTGSKASTNRIQLDIGARGGTLQKPLWVQIVPDYPDVPIFFLLAMTRAEILAEKIRALFMRAAPRDVFDAWCLVQAGIKPSRKLVRVKLKSAGLNLKKGMLRLPTRSEFERDMKGLLPMRYMPNYEQVASDLKHALGAIK